MRTRTLIATTLAASALTLPIRERSHTHIAHTHTTEGLTIMATKTAATKLARTAMQYGHYVESATKGWQKCPVCKERVTADFFAWDKPEPAIRAAIVAHVMEEH